MVITFYIYSVHERMKKMNEKTTIYQFEEDGGGGSGGGGGGGGGGCQRKNNEVDKHNV